jgi:hypothetical protein
VLTELEERFFPIYRRLKDLKWQFLVPDSTLYALDVVAEVRAIHRDHPTLYDVLGIGNPADPLLIGVAKNCNGIVVTDEKSSGKRHKSKIPFVCTGRNVGWSSGPNYLRSIGVVIP